MVKFLQKFLDPDPESDYHKNLIVYLMKIGLVFFRSPAYNLTPVKYNSISVRGDRVSYVV